MSSPSPLSNRSLWSEDALRALIAEACLAEQSSPPLMETSDAE